MQALYFLPKVDSTNNFAATLLEEHNFSNNAAIVSYNQQNGRGQRGNSWICDTGKDLAASFLISNLNMEAKLLPSWSMFWSCVICDFFRQHMGLQVKIKWPNDLFFKGKKLGGILLENQLGGNQLRSSIFGIGINVNGNADSKPNAISLRNAFQQDILLDEISVVLCRFINKQVYHRPTDWDFHILDRYHSHLFGLGQELSFIHHHLGEIRAKVCGVHSSGLLQLELADGKTGRILCDIQEIKWLF